MPGGLTGAILFDLFVNSQLRFNSELFERSCSGFFPSAEQVQEYFGGFLSLLIGELFNAGYRGKSRVVDHGLIGEADEADVLVYPELHPAGILSGVESNIVIETKQGRRFLFKVHQLRHGFFGAFSGKVGGGDEMGGEFQWMGFERFTIPVCTLTTGIELFGSVEHADGPVAVLKQEFYRLCGPCFHVAGYVMDVVEIGDAIEEHNGDAITF